MNDNVDEQRIDEQGTGGRRHTASALTTTLLHQTDQTSDLIQTDFSVRSLARWLYEHTSIQRSHRACTTTWRWRLLGARQGLIGRDTC